MNENGIEADASALKGRIKDAVDTLAGDARGAKAEGSVENAYSSAKQAAGEQAGDFGKWLEGFVRGRPLLALLAAAGIGYSLAGMGRRGRH